MIANNDMTDVMLQLLARTHLVTDGFVIAYYARYDAVLDDYHRGVHVRPQHVDPTTFQFGDPGAYAALTVASRGDDTLGYHVQVHTTNVAYTYQQAGHVVTFTDPAEALRVAVSQVRENIRRYER